MVTLIEVIYANRGSDATTVPIFESATSLASQDEEAKAKDVVQTTKPEDPGNVQFVSGR